MRAPAAKKARTAYGRATAWAAGTGVLSAACGGVPDHLPAMRGTTMHTCPHHLHTCVISLQQLVLNMSLLHVTLRSQGKDFTVVKGKYCSMV